MQNVLTVIWVFFATLTILVFGYYSLRIVFGLLASKNILFTSPKLGRIVAKTREGRISGYIGNLWGLGYSVDKKTGTVTVGERNYVSFLWWAFGVTWIGLDKIHRYPFDVVKIDENGKIKVENVTAESIFHTGSYLLEATDAETTEGTPVSIRLRVNLQTVNAGLSLRYPNWQAIVFDAIKAACRDFVGAHGVRELFTMQNEGALKLNVKDIENSGFVELIKSLNNNIKGNPGLDLTVGQTIVSVNLITLVIEDAEIKNLIQAKLKAEETGNAGVATARLAAEQAEHEAKKKRTIADADLYVKQQEAEGMKAMVKAFDGKPDLLVETLKWKYLGEIKGTLAFGGGKDAPPVIVGKN